MVYTKKKNNKDGLDQGLQLCSQDTNGKSGLCVNCSSYQGDWKKSRKKSDRNANLGSQLVNKLEFAVLFVGRREAEVKGIISD